MTATPDDDYEAMNERGLLTAVANSVPDIKIYRRSAMLYTGDDADDYVIHRSNHRSVCLSFSLKGDMQRFFYQIY